MRIIKPNFPLDFAPAYAAAKNNSNKLNDEDLLFKNCYFLVTCLDQAVYLKAILAKGGTICENIQDCPLSQFQKY